VIAMTLGELAEITDGRLHGVAASAVVDRAPVIDSRQAAPGALFVAIRGDSVDGHDFAQEAVAAGATAVLAGHEIDAPSLVVDDTVAALGRVAAEIVRRLQRCTVVGITGSQGKTSTKDLLSQVLATAGATVATAGNLNNEIGVPLTCCRADANTRFLVCEMGARGLGNIAYLCSIAQPSIGVVLNVGTAHIGEFGSQDLIARSKGELVEALPTTGSAVLNADDEAVRAMAGRTRASVLTYGAAPDADVRVGDLRLGADGTPAFTLHTAARGERVRLGLLGAHQATNAAAAAAAALAAGLDLSAIAAALGSARSLSAWRMEHQVRPDGVIVVNDAYNANPDSMRSALETIATMAAARPGRAVAVLGEMLELGDAARTEHEAVGRLAAEAGLTVIAVGDGARGIHDGAVAIRGESDTILAVEGHDDAIAWLDAHLQPGDLVLVKASRAAGLERVAASLVAPSRHTAWGVNHGRAVDEGTDAR